MLVNSQNLIFDRTDPGQPRSSNTATTQLQVSYPTATATVLKKSPLKGAPFKGALLKRAPYKDLIRSL